MAFVYIGIFNILGSVSLSFAFGWKLSLVSFFGALPFIMAAGFYRVRYELVFEKLNAQVFAESSQFAAEAIGAFRTVASLTLEDMICERYASLLQNHVKKAFNKAKLSTLIFAASESVVFPCMALTFW